MIMNFAFSVTLVYLIFSTDLSILFSIAQATQIWEQGLEAEMCGHTKTAVIMILVSIIAAVIVARAGDSLKTTAITVVI